MPMGADPAEIRRAYLRLARRHHPDFHTDEDQVGRARSGRRMQEINEAWQVLGEPTRRRRYDAELDQGTAHTSQAWRPAPPGPAWRPRAGDTGWMQDFEAWRQETDGLLPEEDSGERHPLMILPVALFAASVALGCVAMVLQARALLASAFVGVGLSAALFFVLPMIALSRSRRDDPDR